MASPSLISPDNWVLADCLATFVASQVQCIYADCLLKADRDFRLTG